MPEQDDIKRLDDSPYAPPVDDDSDETPQNRSDEMEVDAALAALASLDDLAYPAQPDEQDETTEDPITAEDAETDEETPEARALDLPDADDDLANAEAPMPVISDFQRPMLARLQRGQMASVLPALLLMSVGGGLTFALTTDARLPPPAQMGALGVAGLGLVLLTYWLTMRRGSVGNFFVGMTLLMLGGITFYLLQPQAPTLQTSWTFWVVGLGVALLLTGVFGGGRRMALLGFAVALAGAGAYALLAGFVSLPVSLNLVAPVVGGVGLFFLVLPMLKRR